MARSKQVKRKGQGPPAKKRAEEQLPSDLEDEVEKFHKSRDKLSLHASDGGCRAAATCGVHVQAGGVAGVCRRGRAAVRALVRSWCITRQAQASVAMLDVHSLHIGLQTSWAATRWMRRR